LLAAGGTPYCGGTEVLAAMRMGLLAPAALVDLKRVPELAGISVADSDPAGISRADGDLMLGARVTHAQVSRSPEVRRHAPLLAAATSQVGNARVRASGTLAGNICFAEPRSDVLTALLALQARVELRSAEGARTAPIGEFVQDSFTTSRQDTELVSVIQVPKQPAPGAYLRFQPAEYPAVTVAATADPDGCRVVVGAIGGRPELFSYASVDDVDADAVAEQVEVVADLNGAEDYKRHLAAVFVRRAVAELRGSARRV
ncbi:MAG: FAD binding domain-containing protein, partial [Micromonosporaceae bacterium]